MSAESGGWSIGYRLDAACRRACRHADCCMDRGDALPGIVTRAWWPDGSEYSPRALAVADSAADKEDETRIEADVSTREDVAPADPAEDEIDE